MLKAIIFDFDGVIHDTFDLAYATHLEVSGKQTTIDEYKDMFNGNILKHAEKSPEDMRAMNMFYAAQNEKFEDLVMDPEHRTVIEQLADDFPLYIISSNQEAAIDIFFRNNDFTEVFTSVLGAETHSSKVEKFKQVFAQAGVTADECLFITDTLGDIREGHEVGLPTIAVDYGFHERERLEQGKPYAIVSSLADVLPIAKRLQC